MTNKGSSHQHGLVNRGRPKSKLRKRLNKAKSVARKLIIIAERKAADRAEAKKKAA